MWTRITPNTDTFHAVSEMTFVSVATKINLENLNTWATRWLDAGNNLKTPII